MTDLYLPRPTSASIAEQCREMGLAVGDKIIGRESHGKGDWHEAELTVLFLGESEAVFRVITQTSLATYWVGPRETTAWNLSYRRWRRV